LASRQRRGDGTTLGVILALVITSGFVVGTTATFTSTTTNANNKFVAASLSTPGNLTATPSGANVVLAWANATGLDVTSAGYRVNWADWKQAPQTPDSSCGLTSAAFTTKVGVSQTGAGLTDSSASSRANFVDGREYCYQVQTSYPCCPEGANPWLSQDVDFQQGNPTMVAVVGTTMIDAIGVNGGVSGGLDSGDYFEFTFNQAVNLLPTTSDYICTDGTGEAIWIGINGTNNGTCPRTSNPNKDTIFKGFRLVSVAGNSDSGIVGGSNGATTAARYAISGVTTPACTGSIPCAKVRITVGAPVTGSATATASGTFTVQTTADPAYVKSTTGGRKYCAAQTTFTTVSTFALIAADPTGGRCVLKNKTIGI
jgi:hypothetical protein